MSKIILCFTLILSSALTSQALLASPLDDARTAGQIFEVASGYVQATDLAPAKVKALAADVNNKRKAAYERIAKKNGLTVDQVAAESYKKRNGG